MTTTGNYVLKIKEVSRENIPQVGVKAANLGELARAGLPVPDGFVLTTEAFDAFVKSNAFGAGNAPEDIGRGSLAPYVAALSAAAAEMGVVPVAVRSSGVAEDLAGASFAGQYETVLDVRGTAALVAAVRKCWASAFSRRVKEYQAAHGQSGVPRMAVLVQRMVKADAAGVAFTANPVTGDDEVVVSAVRGLGERLVSGQASPDEWVVKGDEATCKCDPEKAIDASQARAVAELAKKVEKHFNAPQDIEWAIAGGKLYLLQARPITALPVRPEMEIPQTGAWYKDTSHFPLPIAPFSASTYIVAQERAMSTTLPEFGVPTDRVECRSLGGELYIGPVPASPSSFPDHLRVAQEAFRSNLAEKVTRRWWSEWREQFKKEGKALLSQDLAKLDDDALIGHLDQVLDFMNRGAVVHLRLRLPYMTALYEFKVACNELLGWDDARAMSLLPSDFSSEPGVRLAELAATVSKSSSARKILSEGGTDVLGRLREAAPDIAGAFQSYVNEYGHRAINHEPGSPTLAENPELFVRLLRDRLAEAAAPRPDSALARKKDLEGARSALAGRSAEDRERFERTLALAELAYPVREDDVFYTDNVPGALARYAVIEIGRRLVARSSLANAVDAVFLTDNELRDAFRGKLVGPQALVDRRKAEQAWVAAHPGPRTYGNPQARVDPRVLPHPLSLIMAAQLWFEGLDYVPQSKAAAAEGQIVGSPGSPGRYTGTARIVRNEAEFSRLGPGEVLVCPITSPAWSVLFAQAGAVVTDRGGVLSHAAIVAREHGIPAVMATGDATRRLHDGQTVTVDGTAGIVQAGP